MRTETPTHRLHRIGEYTVVRRLGSGGMGEVFLVRHPRLPRVDAVKLLRAGAAPSGSDALARFDQEAGLLARLAHPNIVAIHDRGRVGGRPWIAMEYVDGSTAGDLARRGPMPACDVVTVIRTVASALDYAWAEHRVVHRDIKPDNILVTADRTVRRVKVADFGIAKALDRPAGITAAGIALGTVGYAAPEVLTGEGCDHRSDLYSLAATATTLLTGMPPFRGERSDVLAAQLAGHFPPPTVRGAPVPPQVAAVLRRGLSPAPADRYPTAGAFAAALSEAVTRVPRPPIPHVPGPRVPTLRRPGGGAPSGPAPQGAAAPSSSRRGGRRRTLRRLAVIAVGLACVAGLGAAVVTASERTRSADAAVDRPAVTAPAPSERTVPDFAGLTLLQASERASASGLEYVIDDAAARDDAVVTAQDPAPGTAGFDGAVRLAFS